MKIAITNNTGLRNRGCEALVMSLIEGLKRNISDTLDLELHTNDPSYDRWRLNGIAEVRPSYLTLTPNHLSNITLNRFAYGFARVVEAALPSKVAGHPIQQIAALRAADLVLPTGGDIITSDYGNLRKHLSSIVSLDRRKAALIAHTIGPFRKEDEEYFRQAVNKLFLITVRESESYEYLKSLNLDVPLHQTADVAFGLTPTSKEKSIDYLKFRYGLDPERQKYVALSVSEGVIRYSNLERAKYFSELKEFVRRINKNGYFVLLVPHVMERNPNNNDLIACEELHGQLEEKSMTRILSGEYTASDFKGIIGLADCLLGARTHATIASMSQGVPTVSIAYSRKAYGIMNDVFGREAGAKLTLDARHISADNLEESFREAMNYGGCHEVASRMKSLAETNYHLLASSLSEIQ